MNWKNVLIGGQHVKQITLDGKLLFKKGRLPIGYEEVEWIESVGQLYINTGITPSNQTKIEIKYRLYNENSYNSVFGSKTGYNFFVNRGQLSNNNAYYWTNSSYNVLGVFSQTNYNITIFDVPNRYISNFNGDNSSTSRTNITFNYFPNIPMYVFARNNNGSVAYASDNMRLWYFKIWSGNTLVRDFIPCYRTSDKEIGLYDLINNTFYPKTGGTGIFIATEPFNKFQQVEWIESDGNQWIDTGLDMNYINDIKFKFNITKMQTTNTAIFGANSSGGEVLLFYTGGYCYLNGTSTIYNYTTGTDYDVDFNITDGNGSLTINNNLLVTATGSSNSKRCYLFGSQARSSDTTPTYLASYKLYSFKITNSSNILVRNMIPCYRKSNGEIGLYDLANNAFYTNQGTGTFTKGADVN